MFSISTVCQSQLNTVLYNIYIDKLPTEIAFILTSPSSFPFDFLVSLLVLILWRNFLFNAVTGSDSVQPGSLS